MASRADAWLERLLGDRPRIAKLAKYSTASVSGVVTTQIVLAVCLVLIGIGAVTSNVIAVTAGAIPNYLINRAWTFNKRGAHSFTREVLPFWLMAVLGLVLSTIAVAWVSERWGEHFLLVSGTGIAAFGVLWVAKYFVLDRILFAPIAHVIEHEIEEHRQHHEIG